VDAAGNASETTTVIDASGNELPAFVVIYDPEGGFVTGGGWIDSPAGAFHPGLADFADVVGKASFGFVAKYKKGASTPSGNTEFNFKAGDLKFKSSTYEWLVVAGKRAQFKGSGAINGNGGYQFMLTGIDGDLQGGDGNDRFRMKIWADNGAIVYDNKTDGDLDDSTILSGGQIKIHQ